MAIAQCPNGMHIAQCRHDFGWRAGEGQRWSEYSEQVHLVCVSTIRKWTNCSTPKNECDACESTQWPDAKPRWCVLDMFNFDTIIVQMRSDHLDAHHHHNIFNIISQKHDSRTQIAVCVCVCVWVIPAESSCVPCGCLWIRMQWCPDYL